MKNKISSKQRRGTLITLIIACSLLKVQMASCQNHKSTAPPVSSKQVNINNKSECLNYIKGKLFAVDYQNKTMISQYIHFDNDSTGESIYDAGMGDQTTPFTFHIADTLTHNSNKTYRLVSLKYPQEKPVLFVFWDDGNLRNTNGALLNPNIKDKEKWMVKYGCK